MPEPSPVDLIETNVFVSLSLPSACLTGTDSPSVKVVILSPSFVGFPSFLRLNK